MGIILPSGVFLLVCSITAQAGYVGKEIGPLSQLAHGIRGKLYAVDARTLYLKDFHYDGEGPAAYFYVGAGKRVGGATAEGRRLRDERGGGGPLRRYRGEGVTLSLPEGLTLSQIRWFTVWCDEFETEFGSATIPRQFQYPRPARLAALRGVHGVSSDPVLIVDAQTLLLPNFSYDGEAPDAKFWVGRGDTPSPQGIRIPDENGKETPLRKYDKKTIVLTLPGDLTVFDIGHFAVWCEAFTVNFGHVVLSQDRLANVPPSLNMLGVSPQSKLNCEVLFDELAFEVRWAVAGDSIVLQLVAKLEDGEYMSFGVSGSDSHSQMVGADVAVAWLDKATLKGYAVDYYLDAKSQCAGVRGSCPDERLGEKTNSLRLLNAAFVNGYSIVTYQRSLKAADQLDRPVLTNGSQPVVWALGPRNSKDEVSYHSHFLKGNLLFEFGRPPRWNCPMPESDGQTTPHAVDDIQSTSKPVLHPRPVPPPAPVTSSVSAWDIPPIMCHEPADGVFYAQMGPTGGKQGYPAITGHVGWGISWYINGLLIPEINVVRGKKYTFVVEGGSNPDVPARYHPFYITNDPVGGYAHKSDEEKKGIEIYAGVRRSRTGATQPTGVGRLCTWTADQAAPSADEYPSFGAYQRALTLVCEEGSPGVVTWVPDKDTPNTVYYQCFTHRHLGWKINVLDECDTLEAESSEVSTDILQGEESIQVPTHVKPDNNFILEQRKKYSKIINTKNNYNDFSKTQEAWPANDETDQPNMKKKPAPVNAEHNSPVSTTEIKNIIEAAEQIEYNLKDEFIKDVRLGTSEVQQTFNKDPFLPEQPIGENETYVVDIAKIPNYMLPVNQKPLTLQSVMRPHSPSKYPIRPIFRRPAPPEIKRRPLPPKISGYPLSMPSHGIYIHNGMPQKSKQGNKHSMSSNVRYSVNPNRPQQNAPIPSIKNGMSYTSKPTFNHVPPRHPSQMTHNLGQSIIMGKPTQSQTLSLGKTDIIGNHVVKSQITLPNFNEQVAQHSSPQTYFTKPGQIILGKPMENPLPLDQQMTPTIQYPLRLYPAPVNEITTEQKSETEVKPSDFMEESTQSTSIAPAVNTGFKPDSIVVESGFKPIIREPLMESEDTRVDLENPNRREDINIEENYDSPLKNAMVQKYVPSEKLTESFEPIFIPSPEDHILPTNDKTREIFPSNHAKEDRPHPVYVKSENELDSLFSKKNIGNEVPSDMITADVKVNSQYSPSKTNLSSQDQPSDNREETTFDDLVTTFDDSVTTASATNLTKVPQTNTHMIFSSKLKKNTEELSKYPHFKPYKGQIPQLGIIENVFFDMNEGGRKDNITFGSTFINAITEDSLTEKEEKKPMTEQQKSKGVLEQLKELFGDYDDDDTDDNTRYRRDTRYDQTFTAKNQVEFEPHLSSSYGLSPRSWYNSLTLVPLILFNNV